MNIKTKNQKLYIIAKTWKRIISRIFDFFLIGLILFILELLINKLNNNFFQEWFKLIFFFIINLIFCIMYFIFIPWKFNGQTIGKFIFKIRLVNKKEPDLKLKNIFYREIFLVFIPLILNTSIIIFLKIFFNKNIYDIFNNNNLNYYLNIFIRSIISFDFAWYFGITIVIKIDKYHQLFFDRYYQHFVINKNYID